MARPKKNPTSELDSSAPDPAVSAKAKEAMNKSALNRLSKFAARMVMHETQGDDAIQETVFMRTGCLPLDLVNSGKGIPRGRFTMLYSEPGAGKTTLLFTAARGMCLNGYKVLYIDTESSDDTAAQMGLIGPDDRLLVPKGSFMYLSVTTYKEVEEIFDAFIESDFDCCFYDSMTATNISRDNRRKAGKTVEDYEQMGREAQIQTKLLKGFYGDTKDGDKAFVYIVQTRNKIDMRNPAMSGPTAAGSLQSKFVTNITIRMKPSTLIKSGVQVVGRQAYLVSEKNRYSLPFVNIPATVLFGRGVSNIELLTLMGKWLGVFEQKGTRFNVVLPNKEPVSVNGNVGLNNWVKEHYDDMVGTFYDCAPDFLLYLSNGMKDVDQTVDTSKAFQQPAAASGGEDEEGLFEDDISEVSEDEMNSALADGEPKVMVLGED